VFGLFILGMACPAFGQDKITFYFNPPDGTSFVETLRHTKSVSAPGVFEPQAQVSEQRAKYLIRKTATGYSVLVIPIQPTLRVSEGTEGIIRSLFSIAEITYHLDAEGQLVRVEGAEALMGKLEKLIPPELFQAVLVTLGEAARNPAQLAARLWVNRGMLGTFAGRTIQPGHVYRGKGNVPLPVGGSVVGTAKIEIAWPTPCSHTPCAKVELRYESDDQTIGERLALMLRTMFVSVTKALDPSFDERRIPQFQVTGSTSTVETTRSVDPATGLIYAEKEIRTLQGFFAVEKEDKSKFLVRETLDYSYAYQ
jgi:hypothetical protein